MTSGSHGVIVVAGAGGGIGSAVARAAAELGRLVLTDVDGGALDRTVATIEPERIAGLVVGDLRDAEVRRAVRRRVDETGDLTGLAFTAGIGPVQTDDGIDILDVNLRTPVLLSRELRDAVGSGASFVTIGSTASRRAPDVYDDLLVDSAADDWLERWRADPPDAWAAYALSKRGVVLAAARDAVEWGRDGVRVNVVAPSQTSTDLGVVAFRDHADIREFVGRLPIPRMATPDEVAAAFSYLLGPGSTFTTGIELFVDGGASAASTTIAVPGVREVLR